MLGTVAVVIFDQTTNSRLNWSVYTHQSNQPSAWLTCSNNRARRNWQELTKPAFKDVILKHRGATILALQPSVWCYREDKLTEADWPLVTNCLRLSSITARYGRVCPRGIPPRLKSSRVKSSIESGKWLITSSQVLDVRVKLHSIFQ